MYNKLILGKKNDKDSKNLDYELFVDSHRSRDRLSGCFKYLVKPFSKFVR